MSTLAPIQEFRDKPSKRNQNRTKRKCQHEQCTTILSVYNLTYYCSLHEHIYANPKSFI
jgi:hypothetical protein